MSERAPLMACSLPEAEAQKPAEPTPSLVVVVADLLEQSKLAHSHYRRHAGSCDKEGNILQAYNERVCLPAVETALNTRLEAHKLDPQHLDPAWRLPAVSENADPRASHDAMHEELIRFYRKFLR